MYLDLDILVDPVPVEFIDVAGPSAEIPCTGKYIFFVWIVHKCDYTIISETPPTSARTSESSSSLSDHSVSRRSSTPYHDTLEQFISIQREMKEVLSKVAADFPSAEDDKKLLNCMLDRQEAMLKSCTDTLVAAIRSVNKNKKRRKRRSSSSSSSSN